MSDQLNSQPEIRSGTRVIVAEDERLIAEELRHRLTALGFDVVAVVATGDLAVRAAAELQPDLMFMDIRLEGDLDGIDAAAAILEHRDLPIVFLTAHSDDITIARARRVGPYGYLVKPVREHDLRVTATMALQRFALEQRVRESEERFSITLSSIGHGVISTDEHGRVTFMNPVAEELTRWPRADGLDKHVPDIFRLIDAISRLPLPDPIQRALSADGTVTLGEHAVLVARDGTERAIDDSAAPIRDARGNVRGAVLVFRDVTEQEAAREALVAAEDRLRESQQLESVGRLAGGVAHEFNNMMMVVTGYSSLLLEDGGLSDGARQTISKIKQAGDRAATVARQLLAFSRRQILHPIEVNLNEAVSGMSGMLHSLLGEDVELKERLASNLAHCFVDKSQIELVIMNLCINARDAMPGGGAINISTRNATVDASYAASALELPLGEYVVLSVGDTGVGMAPDIQSIVFEPFFTTKDIGKGTGLGLATCYGIVKQSNGHISVDSEVGAGTTFNVYLPQVAATAGSASAAALSDTEAIPTGTETVLLVEDEDGVREMVRLSLQRQGYHVVLAGDGSEAILQSQQYAGTIHLLLVDAIMPVMGGRDVWERLKTERPDLRVLFMSGYTEDRILRQGVSRGAAAFLQKPFSRSDLARKVRAVLDAAPS